MTLSGTKPSASSAVDKFTGSNLELKPITPKAFSIFAIYEETELPLSECGQDIAPSQTCTFKQAYIACTMWSNYSIVRTLDCLLFNVQNTDHFSHSEKI